MRTFFGYQLENLREKKGLEQKEVADALGVEYSVYCDYENGNEFPNDDVYKKIANFFDVSDRYLFRKEDEKYITPNKKKPSRDQERQRVIKIIDNIREFYNDPKISWDDKYLLKFAIHNVFQNYKTRQIVRRRFINRKKQLLEGEMTDSSEMDFYDN